MAESRLTQFQADRLTREDIETLAQYNAERARGIVHTEEWDRRMYRLQRRYDREQRHG